LANANSADGQAIKPELPAKNLEIDYPIHFQMQQRHSRQHREARETRGVLIPRKAQ